MEDRSIQEKEKKKKQLTYIVKVAMVELVAKDTIKIFQNNPGSMRILLMKRARRWRKQSIIRVT